MASKNKKTILVVDDIPENIDVLSGVLVDEYDVKAAINGKIALKITEAIKPDLILLDVMMPDMDGFKVCRAIKANPDTSSIPIIFVTAKTEDIDEAYGFECGAVDYIRKPISPSIVLSRVKNHLSLVRADKLEDLARSSVRMLGEAGHYNDTDTGQHIWRMAAYSKALALHCGYDSEFADNLELAAPMHDTGKIGTPDSILKAPRKLNDQEWEVMKDHAVIGAEILSHSDNPVFQMAADIALNHHEKWDGSGYPGGKSGQDIPLSARIVAIADVFDALTMKRPYKEPWPIEAAIEEIRNSSGTHFDPELVEKFCEIQQELITIKDNWKD